MTINHARCRCNSSLFWDSKTFEEKSLKAKELQHQEETQILFPFRNLKTLTVCNDPTSDSGRTAQQTKAIISQTLLLVTLQFLFLAFSFCMDLWHQINSAVLFISLTYWDSDQREGEMLKRGAVFELLRGFIVSNATFSSAREKDRQRSDCHMKSWPTEVFYCWQVKDVH